MIGTITLNPSIDQHLVVRHLVKDDANRASAVFRFPGGKGVNVSKVIRELGGRTHAYALIGGFPGELWKRLLRGLDIPFTAIPVRGDTRINTILTDTRDGTQTRVSALGPKISQASLDEFLEKILSVLPRPFCWALGGSLAPGMKPGTYRWLVRALQKDGTPCVLDADGEALRWGIQARPFMIKPNEYEMQRLVGRALSSTADYLAAGRRLVRKGVSIVAISLGKRGALVVTAKEAFHLSTPSVAVKSKVGAGDSLIGGLVLGLSRKMSLREAARLGVAASTSAVMREAPRLCLKSDIQKLLRKIVIKPLD